MAAAPSTFNSQNHYIVILCGGTGPRLWPLSRANYPKPFLRLFDNQSTLQQTFARAQKIIPKKRIFVMTTKNSATLVKKQIPSANLIVESQKKNTARAIFTATQQIIAINPHASISTLPADHYINNTPKFVADIRQAATLAQNSKAIVVFGIKPTHPDPSFGYIVRHRFFEKPPIEDIKKYLHQKSTYWNSGIYTFSAQTMIEEFQQYQPEYFRTNYNDTPTLSIDKAISEKTDTIRLIPASFDWSDIGEWDSIFKKLPKNQDKIASRGLLSTINSSNCLVIGSPTKLIGLVGVNNLAIIDTKDGLLVCGLDHTFAVRDLISKITTNSQIAKFFLKSTNGH